MNDMCNDMFIIFVIHNVKKNYIKQAKVQHKLPNYCPLVGVHMLWSLGRCKL